MDEKAKVRLSSAEIASLWGTYMNDDMSLCILEYFLNKVQDEEIRPILQEAYDYSYTHVNRISEIFKEEGIMVPKGFIREDFNCKAPRLYTDPFFLFYLQVMGKIALDSFGLALGNIIRSDIRSFYSENINEAIQLYNNVIDLMLEKGIAIRAPIVEISTSKDIDYINKKSFLEGFVAHPRSLITLEIMHITSNLMMNLVAMPLLMGFAQVAQSEKVREYMLKGKSIASSHLGILRSMLEKEDIPVPSTSHYFVTDSIEETFSDRLMMFQVASLNFGNLGFYTTAIGGSFRHDLHAMYGRMASELALFAHDGINVMIENRWMEQPPQAVSHEALVMV